MHTITPRNETEAFIHEKLQALLADLDAVGDAAPYGHVLDELDDYLFHAIRKFGNQVLQTKLQERIDRAEKTDEGKQCPHCKKKTKSHIKKKTKTITTSNNHIRIARRHCRCPHCSLPSFPVEHLLGIEEKYSCGAKRLIGYSVAKASYRGASEMLATFGDTAALVADEALFNEKLKMNNEKLEALFIVHCFSPGVERG